MADQKNEADRVRKTSKPSPVKDATKNVHFVDPSRRDVPYENRQMTPGRDGVVKTR